MRFDDSLNEVFTNTDKTHVLDIEKQEYKSETTANLTPIDNNVSNSSNPAQNGYMYHVDINENKDNLGHNALIAYQYSQGVKYSAICAFFMNLSLVLFNSYYVFFALCSLWGYYTTLQYKPNVTMSYFIYLFINLIVRTSISIYDCVNQFDAGDNIYGGLNITLSILLFIMSLYGIRMVWRQYFYLTMCDLEEQIQLRNLRHLNLKALCW